MSPVGFLTDAQRNSHGRYSESPSPEELARFFHLTDDDRILIEGKRGDHCRLGFAIQLTTVRYLGTFLEDPTAVPIVVVKTLAKQLAITNLRCVSEYQDSERRWIHTTEIRELFGYRNFSDLGVGFRLTRWLYGLCWTGNERPGVLFERTTAWLLTSKVLLPGPSLLERLIARVRSRVDARLWSLLGKGISEDQQKQLENLLDIPEGSHRSSRLDQLRSGPTTVSGPSLVRALRRLQAIREVGITLPPRANIPHTRIKTLARFANTAKVTAIKRLPADRRLATLVAFALCLEATAHDEVLEVLEFLLHDMFEKAKRADKKARFRTLKDLDKSATMLATACRPLLDQDLPDGTLREKVFSLTPREELAQAVVEVLTLVRPPDDVFFRELSERYGSVRRFLPEMLKHLTFDACPTGRDVTDALNWLRHHEEGKSEGNAPAEIVSKSWSRHVWKESGGIDYKAYIFCVLDRLCKAIRRRDVYVTPSWRYADPRAGLLAGHEWEMARPVICRSLRLPVHAAPMLSAMKEELGNTYRRVVNSLPHNPGVRFETVNGKPDLILSPLDKLETPRTLTMLQKAVVAYLPQVDLPEILLEIAARTGFTAAFTHITESRSRIEDLDITLAAVLLAEACNTGLETLVRKDVPALHRDRLSWVSQNFVRDQTIAQANAKLVAAQNQIALAHAWGGGEVASADGLRFVVPIRTIHARPNPKYFGIGRGITYYNLVSDQFTGLNAVVVPGTLRDSLVILSVVLDQQTELKPTQIITDTGAYSDVVFGLFRLLGYRFSPRLADIGGTRLWRIDPHADYGEFNEISRQKVRTDLIPPHWDDFLRIAGSLKMGRVPATSIMRMLQVGDRPTRLAMALAEFGRIEKTLHVLNFINDENQRRSILNQLNRGEGRNRLARRVFYADRGELRQRYREGQEDQLGALGLVVNAIILWNTIYMDAALSKLKQEGYPIQESDVSRLSPLVYSHINVLGRYSFAIPEAVMRGELRPLRDSDEDE